MPRAFRVAIGRIDDGQHRLLHQRRIDQRKPAGRHLHHQPQGGLERWRAHHLGGHRISDQRDQRQEQGLPIASPNGADRVEKVTRGVDDRQAVVTFAKPFSEWRGMFAGNTMLLPKSMTANPEVFNKGQLDRPGPSAGPFIDHRPGPYRAANHVDAQPEMVGHATAAGQHHLSGARRRAPSSRPCRTTPSTPPGWPRCPS